MTWTHDALAADLLDARHGLTEIAVERLALSAGIVDVAAMRLSWTRPRFTIYEVKISRADFLRDTRAGKWRKYLAACERLYFCFPRELLIDLEEVPVEAGILLRGARGWYSRRRAPSREMEPERRRQFVQSLLFRHYPAAWSPGRYLTLSNGRRVTPEEIRVGKVRTLYGQEVPVDTPLEPGEWNRR